MEGRHVHFVSGGRWATCVIRGECIHSYRIASHERKRPRHNL